jgi:alkanesulfonate monooxygenase SsuD/methylene tetrahydromethanopterin reductase-like flavin-dependent oxidoreductase (luciferase family)
MLRVAVKLPPAPGRIGDYLPDVAALDAAGADTVWLEGTSAAADSWIHLGAIAAVTHRIRLGVPGAASVAGWLDGVATLTRLSSSRVVVRARPGLELKALEELKSLRPAPLPISILLICRTPAEARRSAGHADGVVVPGGEDEVRALRSHEADLEVWVEASVPADKAGWAEMVAALEAAGATGVIVPWNPRLIDLLRSAGEPDDRGDLLIATG